MSNETWAAIIGSLVGGGVGLAIALLQWWLSRDRERQRDARERARDTAATAQQKVDLVRRCGSICTEIWRMASFSGPSDRLKYLERESLFNELALLSVEVGALFGAERQKAFWEAAKKGRALVNSPPSHTEAHDALFEGREGRGGSATPTRAWCIATTATCSVYDDDINAMHRGGRC